MAAPLYPAEKSGSNELIPVPAYDEKFGDEKVSQGDNISGEFLPGSENVTQHDLDTLRHVSDSFPYSAWLVVIVEFAERYVDYFFHCQHRG